MYYTYIIRSLSSGKFYTGSTSDLEERIIRHQNNRNTATKFKGPWILVYGESFSTRSEAIKQEFKIKNRGAGRYLEDLKTPG